MSPARKPAVAGLFYPSDPSKLRAMIRRDLAACEASGAAPKAIIAPHAGYIYSGPIAASAYARLALGREKLQRVILLGPSHRVPFRGLAASSADAFETPLGDVPLDRPAIDGLLQMPQVRLLDAAHAQEHSLEVQVPFLQVILGAFNLVPLAVGEAEPEEVAEVLLSVWGGEETAVVVSSDLSHYHDYETARRLDEATSRAIETLRPEDIEYEDACGRAPVNGLLRVARARGLRATTLDLRNSGDTAGSRDRSRVVGYGAYAFA
jgi:AmmeMemoRadiSam system protein B